jgi:zinc protease
MAIDRSQLPAPGPDPGLRFPEVRRGALANGLRVTTVEHRGVPVVSFLLLLPCGSAADPAERPGLAALTADMLDEGSGNRSALEIEDALSGIGAQFETEVGSDATVLSLLVLPRFSDTALGLLSDIVTRPRLARADFDRVRDLRLNRLRQLRDLAPAVADLAFARLLYGGHPYGRLPIGTIQGLESSRLEDVAWFHAQVWRPMQATIVAAGDAPHDELFRTVARAFGGWEPGDSDGTPPLSVRDPMAAPAPPRPSAPLALVDRPRAAQSEIRIGQVGAHRLTPDYYPLLVLNAILGGQFVSRLNMNLREDKGYTYGVRSGFEFRRAPGPFLVQAAVQTGVTADAVREVLTEVRDIATARPATPAELDLAKSALTRGYARSFETAGQIARGYAQLALYELPDDTLEQFVPSVQAVDIDAVSVAAQRFDASRTTVAIVGDREKVEPGLQQLGIGNVTIMDDDER